MGGPGSERDVSLASGKAVAEALRGEGCQVIEVDVATTTPEIPEGVQLVFNVIHGTFGEDGGLQSYLDGLGIPYTGTDAESSRVAFDKLLSKEKFIAAGVPTPASESVSVNQIPSMSLPFVIKPPCEGSSVGIHVVKKMAQLQPAMRDASQYARQILIEEFVEGRELTVGVMNGEVFPIVEIIPPEDGWYDMATKYPWLSGGESEEGSQYVCPAEFPADVTESIQAAALAAYKSLNIEVYARVDVLVNSLGKPYVLEVNTIPGMTETSLLPMGGKQAGYDFGPLCLKIAELSLAARAAASANG